MSSTVPRSAISQTSGKAEQAEIFCLFFLW